MSICPDCDGKGLKEYDAGLVQIGCKTCEMTGRVDCELTKEEFEKAYAFRSDMTPDQVAELGLVAMPCDCDEDDCKGWAMQRAESTLAPANTTTIIIGDTKVNLCDTCVKEYPVCDSPNVEFGDGVGLDNIIKCAIYSVKSEGPTDEELKAAAEAKAAALEERRSTRELKPNEYRCSKCSKPGKTAIHILKKDGKGIGHKHLEFKVG